MKANTSNIKPFLIVWCAAHTGSTRHIIVPSTSPQIWSSHDGLVIALLCWDKGRMWVLKPAAPSRRWGRSAYREGYGIDAGKRCALSWGWGSWGNGACAAAVRIPGRDPWLALGHQFSYCSAPPSHCCQIEGQSPSRVSLGVPCCLLRKAFQPGTIGFELASPALFSPLAFYPLDTRSVPTSVPGQRQWGHRVHLPTLPLSKSLPMDKVQFPSEVQFFHIYNGENSGLQGHGGKTWKIFHDVKDDVWKVPGTEFQQKLIHVPLSPSPAPIVHGILTQIQNPLHLFKVMHLEVSCSVRIEVTSRTLKVLTSISRAQFFFFC